MIRTVVAEILSGPRDGEHIAIPEGIRDYRFVTPHPPTWLTDVDDIHELGIRSRICPVIHGVRFYENGDGPPYVEPIVGIDWINGVER